jgi:predicted RNA-binding Zn-ribbon protein involved in translation (DUF1610 family)
MADDDEKTLCASCDADITDEDNYDCDECGETMCEECVVQFESAGTICKSCIDDAYPRESEVVEKIVEKIVEVPKEVIKVVGFSEPIL